MGPVEILILLLCGLMLFGGTRHAPAVSKTLAAVACLGLFLCSIIAVLFYVRSSENETATLLDVTVNRLPPNYTAPVVDSDVWQNTANESFSADVYPGVSEATIRLAWKVGALLGSKQTAEVDTIEVDDSAELDTTETKMNIPEIKITANDENGRRILQQFLDQLQLQRPDIAIHVMEESDHENKRTEPTPTDVVLTLRVETSNNVPAPWDYKQQQETGRVCCDVAKANGTATITIDYIDKPWVTHFGPFISARPDRQLHTGYSTKFTSSEAEARRLAMQDGTWRTRVDVGGGRFVVADESHVIDRFAQKLSRPYGDVWREAVLLDVSGTRMAPPIAAAKQQNRNTATRQTSLAVSLLVLFGTAVVLCFVLNLLTQGYYGGRLWLSATVVGGFALLLLFIAVVVPRFAESRSGVSIQIHDVAR